MKRLLVILVLLVLSTPTWAQDNTIVLGNTFVITAPNGCTPDETTGNKRTVCKDANGKDTGFIDWDLIKNNKAYTQPNLASYNMNPQKTQAVIKSMNERLMENAIAHDDVIKTVKSALHDFGRNSIWAIWGIGITKGNVIISKLQIWYANEDCEITIILPYTEENAQLVARVVDSIRYRKEE